MSFEDQPPWREGNPAKYKLLEHRDNYRYATTCQVGKQRGTVVLATWIRQHVGGRDCVADDFIWNVDQSIIVSISALKDLVDPSSSALKNLVDL